MFNIALALTGSIDLERSEIIKQYYYNIRVKWMQ